MADERTWFVLHHTAGASLPAGESVFDQPGIREHFAFLQRRAEAGQLVAAGPLPTEANAGMTVLAVESLADAQRLATEDDRAVAEGTLQVTVQPWLVVMAPALDPQGDRP